MYISTNNNTEWKRILSERHFSQRVALNLTEGAKKNEMYIESLGS